MLLVTPPLSFGCYVIDGSTCVTGGCSVLWLNLWGWVACWQLLLIISMVRLGLVTVALCVIGERQ